MAVPLEARFLSKSAYARHRGVSPQMVGQWAKAGRLKIVEGRVDAFESDAMLARSLDPARGGKGGKPSRVVTHAVAALPAVAPATSADDAEAMSFQAARAKREEFAAKTAEAEYRKMIGELVERAAVTKATTEVYAVVRRDLQRVADVVAARVAAETEPRKCRAIIAQEIEAALSALAGKLERLPEQPA